MDCVRLKQLWNSTDPTDGKEEILLRVKKAGILRTFLSYFCVSIVTAAVVLGALYLWEAQDPSIRFDGERHQAEQVLAYHGDYEQYTSSHYEQYLNEKERLLYQALKYAYDHGVQRVRLAEEYDQESVTNINAVLKADYPQYTTSMLSMEMALRPGETRLHVNQKEFEGVQKNEQMVPLARKVIDSMSQGLDEFSRAKYLYEYLVRNVAYTSEKGEDFALMSGVFELGRANCDGFASALQLLYQMAGIECYKVYYHGSDIGSDVGHVWNIAVVDGVPYHVDASRGALVTQQLKDTFSSAGADGREAVSYSGFLMTEDQALGAGGNVINPFIRDKIDSCTMPKPAKKIYDAVQVGEKKEEFVSQAAQALQNHRGMRSVFLSFHFTETAQMLQAQENFTGNTLHAYARRIGERAGFYGRVITLNDTSDDKVLCAIFEWGT